MGKLQKNKIQNYFNSNTNSKGKGVTEKCKIDLIEKDTLKKTEMHCAEFSTADLRLDNREEERRGTEMSKQGTGKGGNSPKVVAVEKSCKPAETPECPAKKE